MICKKCRLGIIDKGVIKNWGSSKAPILVLIDNPSKVDESFGRLMFGPEGKLLQELFKDAFDALGIKPLHIYVTSIVRCRPTEAKREPTREPSSDEVLSCTQRLMGVLQKVKPKHIFLAGKIVERYYKKELPDAYGLQPIRFILKQGGKSSPWYLSSLRTIMEAIR